MHAILIPCVAQVYDWNLPCPSVSEAILSRIKIAKSPICPHCSDVVPESLTHFACVRPKFREARTSAHNKVRIVITSFLNSTLGANWEIFEETRMSKTGLKICSTPQATAEQWGRRQPDWVLVSQHHKRIAIVDLPSVRRTPRSAARGSYAKTTDVLTTSRSAELLF